MGPNFPALIALALAACGPGGDPPPSPVQADVAYVDGLAGGVEITVRGDGRGDRAIVCQSGDDRWEALRPESDPVARWYGLLPSSLYACAAVIGQDVTTFSLHTPDLPADLPTVDVTGETTGFTLFNHVHDGHGQKLVIVDPQGRIRWYRYLEGDPNVGLEANFLPVTSHGPLVLVGGGEGYAPSLIALDGTRVWQGPPVGFEGGAWNHDVAWRDDDESVVALSWSTDDLGDRGTVDGAALERITAFTGQSEWTWTTQEPYDRGEIAPGIARDAWHANALEWHADDPEGPAYWVSLKAIHQVVRLDPDTGDVTWRLGVGGDFQLLEADGAPATDDRWFYGQHAPEAHPTADPWVWDVWVHDNGLDRPTAGDPFTRALELEVDLRARTARIAWEWTEPGWYEPVFGDVDVLADGHLLITEAHCPQCQGAADRTDQIVEIDPANDGVSWRLVERDPNDSGYRSQRIDACDLFPENTSSCPTGAPVGTAARLAREPR